MTSELRDIMAQLELSLVEAVTRLEDAETARLMVGVLDLEQRVEALQDALAFVADSIAAKRRPPIAPPPRSLPRPAPHGDGVRAIEDPPAAG